MYTFIRKMQIICGIILTVKTSSNLSPFEPTIETARRLDEQDALAHFRDDYVFDDNNGALPFLYMDGNSLGRLPRQTLARMDDAVRRQWGERLIRSWGEGWYHAPRASATRSAGWSALRPAR